MELIRLKEKGLAVLGPIADGGTIKTELSTPFAALTP